MVRATSQRFLGILAMASLALVTACWSPSVPSGPPPVAKAEVEIRTQHSSNPHPDFDATCQTTASVIFHTTGSHDPAGQSLVYEWGDTVDGVRTPDFFPATNPVRTREPSFAVGLYTLGVHEITLTVIAQDGRKGRTRLTVLVTSCEECGDLP